MLKAPGANLDLLGWQILLKTQLTKLNLVFNLDKIWTNTKHNLVDKWVLKLVKSKESVEWFLLNQTITFMKVNVKTIRDVMDMEDRFIVMGIIT